jgi:hypothetical protein
VGILKEAKKKINDGFLEKKLKSLDKKKPDLTFFKVLLPNFSYS